MHFVIVSTEAAISRVTGENAKRYFRIVEITKEPCMIQH